MNDSGDTVIRVGNLDKCYFKRDGTSGKMVPFYALRNVNFEVGRGEVIGIIGKNGSGKSTLLKILSGITPPTEGVVEIFGTPSSILDIGTGIHPEISGKENVYLRGQLLGMKKQEVDEVFEELVAFSGVGDFIDTAVKHYSSGMFLRLAFSIIVHLRSDILLLDEVLAVGDASFRRRCVAKINDIVERGCTVVLVSHDMGTVMETCSRVILLDKGRVISIGSQKDVVQNMYMSGSDNRDFKEEEFDTPKLREIQSEDYGYKVERFGLFGIDDLEVTEFESADEVKIRLDYTILKNNVNLAIGISDVMDVRLIDDSPVLKLSKNNRMRNGRYKVTWTIPSGLFNAGTYFIGLYAFDNKLRVLKIYNRVVQFKVTDKSVPKYVQEFQRAAFKVNLKMQIQRLAV